RVMPCCVSLDGEYGQKDICLGVPVTIGKNGWETIVDYKLTAEEQELFNKSADAVRNMNNVLSEIGVL
ncbi:MAG: malate dehydrogenase, partial [Candidatus Methylacidiphilales bacterium]